MPQLMPRSFIPDDEEEIDALELTTPKSFIADEQEEEEQPNILRKVANVEIEALKAAGNFLASRFKQKDKPKSTASKADVKLAEDVEKGFKKGVSDPEALKEFINSIASSRPEIESKPQSLAERFVSSRIPAYKEESSVLDSEMTNFKRSLDSVANPKTLSDFMALVIPNIAGEGSSAINKLLKKTPIEELPIRRGKPQEDAVAIALTRDYPRTSQNISAETGIPKASVRRVLSERRKKGLSSLEIQPTATEAPPIKQTQAAVSELDEFIKNNPEAKMSEIENFINKTEIPETSLTVIKPKTFTPDVAEQPKKPFVNPFEKPKTTVDEIPVQLTDEQILAGKTTPDKPYSAVYRHYDPNIGEHQYDVIGGPERGYGKSTVGAKRLEQLGIEIPETPKDVIPEVPKTFKSVDEDDIIELHGGLGSVGKGKKKKPIPISGPYGPALDKLFNSMGGVMENRLQQDVINKTERAKRFAAFKGVKDEGMAGASKSLSKLKGEFEKVVPEKLQMQQEEIDTLFTAVKKARITEGEKARGYTALFKLMNGDKLPQRNELRILDDVFGNGFAERIIELHGGLGALNMKIGKVGNTMKAMMSSGDLSMSLRQGVGFAHRPEWRSAVKEQLKYLADPEYFKAAMDAIEERPKFMLGRESGLFLAKPGGLMNGEEMFMNNYVENIPVVKNIVEASERSYVGGLNKLRSDVFDNLTDLAEKSGVKITNKVKNVAKDGTVTETAVPTKEAENIAKYINLFTGRGSLGKLEPIAEVLNTLFWSPKYRASRLQINPIFNPKFYIDLDPFTRKQAAKSLLAMASASLTFNTLATLSGATIGYNLLSSDFMKSRFKRTDNVMDPNAGMQQPVVAAARMINELNRMGSGKPRKFGERNIGEIGFDYLRSGASPIVGLADELISMRKYEGDKKDASLKTFGMPQYGGFTDKYGNKKYLNTELAKRFTSIFSQDIYEIIESDPSFEEGIGLATGSLLGIGEQRYPERKPSDSRLRRMRLQP